jgi:flagellar biosynthesis regulator FlaF
MTHHYGSMIPARTLACSSAPCTDAASDVAQRINRLNQVTARLTYLADEARQQRNLQLEATLTKTAAEVLTSMKEIAAASYGNRLIHRLIERIEQIEEQLFNATSRKGLLLPVLEA